MLFLSIHSSLPGEQEDDKPPPTTIIVSPFNENSPEFSLFGVCHVQKAAVVCQSQAIKFTSSLRNLFSILHASGWQCAS
jgi:hypothetical protein